MKNYHITKKNDIWQFKEENSKRSIKNSDTKEQAIDNMREFMKDKTGSVKIHKTTGLIQEERTYQRKDDPSKTKG